MDADGVVLASRVPSQLKVTLRFPSDYPRFFYSFLHLECRNAKWLFPGQSLVERVEVVRLCVSNRAVCEAIVAMRSIDIVAVLK